jgi:hypothetical protein
MYDTEGEAAGKRQALAETRAHFVWVPELAELLKEYQADRARWPTLAEFVPRIRERLQELAAALPKPANAPRLVAMVPANGADAVDPSTTELTFSFDMAMQDESWSVVGSAADLPKITGSPRYDRARQTLTLPVALAPGRSYRFWLNRDDKDGFRSREGVPLPPVEVTFRTKD